MSRWVVHTRLPWLGGWRSTGQGKGSVPFPYKHGQSDHKVTGRAKGWGGFGGLKEMSVILPGKLPWGSDQHEGSSGVPTAIFTLTPLLQALATPSPSPPHPFPPAGEPQTAFRCPVCVSPQTAPDKSGQTGIEHFFQGETQVFPPGRRWALVVHSVDTEGASKSSPTLLLGAAGWMEMWFSDAHRRGNSSFLAAFSKPCAQMMIGNHHWEMGIWLV